MKVGKSLACKVVELCGFGLTEGIGDPFPGRMCIEAAVAFASGEGHNDEPRCVDDDVRNDKVALNDYAGWPSNKARGEGLTRVGVAQLGSNRLAHGAYRKEFRLVVCEYVAPLVVAKEARECKGDAKYKLLSKMIASAKPEEANAAWEIIHCSTGCEGIEEGVEGLMDQLEELLPKASGHTRLKIATGLVEKALVRAKSPGCKWLYLCDKKPNKKSK